MKIKALRPLNGRYGQVAPGQLFDPGPVAAKSLLDRGLAEKAAEPPRNKKAADPSNKGGGGPLAGSRTGGSKQR